MAKKIKMILIIGGEMREEEARTKKQIKELGLTPSKYVEALKEVADEVAENFKEEPTPVAVYVINDYTNSIEHKVQNEASKQIEEEAEEAKREAENFKNKINEEAKALEEAKEEESKEMREDIYLSTLMAEAEEQRTEEAEEEATAEAQEAAEEAAAEQAAELYSKYIANITEELKMAEEFEEAGRELNSLNYFEAINQEAEEAEATKYINATNATNATNYATNATNVEEEETNMNTTNIEAQIFTDCHEVMKAVNKYTEENNLNTIKFKQIKVDGGYMIKIKEEQPKEEDKNMNTIKEDKATKFMDTTNGWRTFDTKTWLNYEDREKYISPNVTALDYQNMLAEEDNPLRIYILKYLEDHKYNTSEYEYNKNKIEITTYVMTVDDEFIKLANDIETIFEIFKENNIIDRYSMPYIGSYKKGAEIILDTKKEHTTKKEVEQTEQIKEVEEPTEVVELNEVEEAWAKVVEAFKEVEQPTEVVDRSKIWIHAVDEAAEEAKKYEAEQYKAVGVEVEALIEEQTEPTEEVEPTEQIEEDNKMDKLNTFKEENKIMENITDTVTNMGKISDRIKFEFSKMYTEENIKLWDALNAIDRKLSQEADTLTEVEKDKLGHDRIYVAKKLEELRAFDKGMDRLCKKYRRF